MIINDANEFVKQKSGLASIEILDDKSIKLALKNSSTLTFVPIVEDGKVVDYKMVYLTGKENKQIAKLQEKIKKLESDIHKITNSERSEDEKVNNIEEEQRG